MRDLFSLTSWVILGIALAAWVGVAYSHIWLHAEALERGSRAKTVEQQSAESARMSRIETIASETVVERGQLSELVHADIVSIASEIERAGKSAGVAAKVNAAIPAGSPKELPGGEMLQSIAFIVQAEGSFVSIVQFIRALETFPSFSSVEQFEIEKMQGIDQRPDAWRSSVRLQIDTTSDITS